MIAKLLSALCSAIVLSLIFSLVQHENEFQQFSFLYQFMAGFFVLLVLFLGIGLPVSLVMERVLQDGGASPAASLRQSVLKLLLYIAAAAALGCVPLIFHGNFNLSFLLTFVAGGFTYYLFEFLFRSKSQRN